MPRPRSRGALTCRRAVLPSARRRSETSFVRREAAHVPAIHVKRRRRARGPLVRRGTLRRFTRSARTHARSSRRARAQGLATTLLPRSHMQAHGELFDADQLRRALVRRETAHIPTIHVKRRRRALGPHSTTSIASTGPHAHSAAREACMSARPGRRQLTPGAAETARMRWLIILALGLCAACSARELVPSFSLHAVMVLRRRDREEVARGRDVAVTAQLAFRGRRTTAQPLAASDERPLPRLSPLSAAVCEETALCEWSRMAEESALAALGVKP